MWNLQSLDNMHQVTRHSRGLLSVWKHGFAAGTTWAQYIYKTMEEMGNYNSILPFQFPALKMTARGQFMPNWNVLPTN